MTNINGCITRAIQALEHAKPIVEKWCHYQGNNKEFHADMIRPIDKSITDLKALKEAVPKEMRDDLYTMTKTLQGCNDFQNKHKESPAIVRRYLAKLFYDAVED